MTERPILFNGEMVRAILDGRKTQTRRPIMFKPRRIVQPDSVSFDETSGRWVVTSGPNIDELKCPYGVPGDRLWVRERARVGHYRRSKNGEQFYVRYEADGTVSGWVTRPARLKYVSPGNCMPNGCAREFSRITLELTEVRIERVRDITEADAIAEGFPTRETFIGSFLSIYPGTVDQWVRALSFKRVKP